MSKKVLITGGNKGIGLAVSRAMLELDYKIIVVARDFKDFAVGVEKIILKKDAVEFIQIALVAT